MHVTYPNSPLPAAPLDPTDPSTLQTIASICRDAGIGLRLHYGNRTFHYPLAASFTSRGPEPARF